MVLAPAQRRALRRGVPRSVARAPPSGAHHIAAAAPQGGAEMACSSRSRCPGGPPRGSPERAGGDRDQASAPHGRRSSVVLADREAQLPWLREARRGAPEVPRDGGGVADRMLLLYVGATSPRAAGSLHRLVGGSAEGQCPFRDLSKPLLNSALGP